ncbi:MAG: hypothetical protein JWN70_97 [Planctomycetaceae bacterium]|nr:hypothetical protein [Planctomycetaceae bacterium]
MFRRFAESLVLLLVLMSISCSQTESAPPPDFPAVPTVPSVPAKVPMVRPPKMLLPQVVDGLPTRQTEQGEHVVSVDLSKQVLYLELPKEIDWREKGKFQIGDAIRVKRNASLRQGTTVLASVKTGQILTACRFDSDDDSDSKWVEVGIVSQGKLVRGWLPISDVEFSSSEPRLHPTLGDVDRQEFASAAILTQKAKQFDDGLMATVQLAAQKGHGQFTGKAVFLERLSQRLSGEKSAQVVQAACILGKVPVQIPTADKRAVDALVAEFLAEPTRSKPIAFYTWSGSLSSLFQQDRMLQTELPTRPETAALVIARALQGDAPGRQAYEAYLTLQSRLTNPPVSPDLRPLLAELDAGRTPQVAKGTRIFPAAYSHEVDLLKQMFPDGMYPPGFQIMEELVKRVKSGRLDLTPRPDSGWYDQQIWSLEPYVRPRFMPEGSHWTANEEYLEHLTKLFKGAWALARETHIKDLEVGMVGDFGPGPEPKPKIKVYVEPQLSAEPVATSYLRRALGYRFVRNLLTDQFGVEGLTQMHRLTATGPVSMNLSEELRQMEGLFHGAYVTVTRQLGVMEKNELPVGSDAGPEADAATYLAWAANLLRDPDLITDTRMMVPVYYDPVRRQTKVWAVLGWTTQTVSVRFLQKPAVSVYDKTGNQLNPERLEITYSGNAYAIATPVFQELMVSKLLNRDEFRLHCDAYETTAAIVKNLSP